MIAISFWIWIGFLNRLNRKTLTLARAQLYLRMNKPIPPPPPVKEKPPLCCPACKTPMLPGLRFKPGELPPSQGPPTL